MPPARWRAATATSSKSVAITITPTASLTGSTTIVRGGTAQLDVALTGTSPWTLTWSDGTVQTNVTNATLSRAVTPDLTTTYTVVPSTGACNGPASQAATVTVIPPSPAVVSATTQENRNVLVAWSAVAGASGYVIERAARVGAVASWSTTVGATTSYADVVPASSAPVTYIYYVRTIDQYGMLSGRGAWDHATAATQLWLQPVIQSGVTIIAANDVAELRGAIDALRYAFSVSPAFEGVTGPAGVIRAADFSDMVTALSAVAPFAYSGIPSPAAGGMVLGGHIQQLREALR